MLGAENARVRNMCIHITRALTASAALERLLLLPILYPGYAHAELPIFSNVCHTDFIGYEDRFRRLLCVTCLSGGEPKTWLDQVEAGAYAYAGSVDRQNRERLMMQPSTDSSSRSTWRIMQ